MSLIVITPSRDRAAKARDCYDAFLATKTREDTKMVFVVDADDDTFLDYVKQKLPVATYQHGGGGMGPPLNVAAADMAPKYDIVGFIGDDHRFRTQGWDEAMTKALTETPGLAFGNDLARADIPTQVFITSIVVQTLGWMCLPGAKHLYLDNTWRTLGDQLGRITYLPHVIIEHVHPFFGKAEWDDIYRKVNDQAVYDHDAEVYRRWIDSGQMAQDVEKVKAVL